MALTPTPKASDPTHNEVVAECRERCAVGGHCEVREVPAHDMGQPLALLIDRGMHMPS